MAQQHGCPFIITRGVRKGLTCGRSLYRKEGSQYCLQHFRTEKPRQAEIVEPHYEEEEVACAMPIDFDPTKPPDGNIKVEDICLSPAQDEIMYEGTDEEVTRLLYELLQQKRELKRNCK